MVAKIDIPGRSLTTRLIILAIIFVLVAELVVMIPSIANKRMTWFHERLEAAYLVSIALEGPEGRMISEDEARLLFDTAGIRGVTVKRDAARILILAPTINPHGEGDIHLVDLRHRMPTTLIANAWATMFSSGEALIQVTGSPRQSDGDVLDIVVSQKDLRQDLLIYTRNILGLSLIISSLTALLLFYAFNKMIVGPVVRLTRDMTAFENDPDATALVHQPSGRLDEIGAAEYSLAMMQRRIQDLLNERRRLAALGAGISKISHDLRNILASAQLMSDRLGVSEDPAVQKLAPRLVNALDRAISLSRDTLAFSTVEPSNLNKHDFPLSALIDDILEDSAAMDIDFQNDSPESLIVNADRTQLYRALFNLARNSVEAMAATPSDNTSATKTGTLTISATSSVDDIMLRIIDTGPGVSEHARAELFEPFKGSRKSGGSGLGLAIAAEIIRAHGGSITLERSDANGTTFLITLPFSPNEPREQPKASV